MKKILLFVSIFALGTVNAQQRSKEDVEIIPLVGYSSSNYYGDERFNNSSLTSVNFGVEVDYYFNDRWSLRSGLLFQTMGSKVTSYYKEELDYITIPVNANWHFGSTRKWNLNFGPNFGFLNAARANGRSFKNEVNGFQLGLAYGIGYKIEVNKKFSILIDYQGMTGLTEVPENGYYGIKNAYASFNVGGVFKL
ncbi:conserved exported hypothetical protein [Flavobacterium sp. 9AF]|uniref:porin family protein n=1 Tax=Flavobacterium sp. 9AF TaxID=2653142 RepID=UPI0012EF4EDB|nr:porin family protein [Flavobacterium sp. 9AF]VXC36346.1 conserved exported hypothetical protein [Flavobacterium sp. 9AF]